jgi:SAM-dependent methyltransferase
MIKLSLGCGREKKEGFIGLDIEDFGWNKVCDITKDIFPFGDNAVDYLELENVLEHIERKYWRHLFNECHRVLKKDGVLEIISPDATKSIGLAMQDPTHLSFVVKGTFTSYLTGNRPRNADYGFKRWEVITCEDYEKEPRCLLVKMTPCKD